MSPPCGAVALRGLARTPSPTTRPCHALAGPGRVVIVPRRTLWSRRRRPVSRGPSDNLNFERLSQQSQDYRRNRTSFLVAGTIAGLISFVYTSVKLQRALAKGPPPTSPSSHQADSALSPTDPDAGVGRKVVVHDEHGREMVATGNKTVPAFPRTMRLPAHYTDGTLGQASPSPSQPASYAATTPAPPVVEYTLVGFGVRTVTFLSIQVYVVGYYVATADVAALQSALVQSVNPIATTLVSSERDQLRATLLDPAEGERAWDDLLARQHIPARSAFRVIPVRDTDFHHLRDGFVRSIRRRAPPADNNTDSSNSSGSTKAFGDSMRQFRALFNRGTVPSKKELLLVRDGGGRLVVAYDDGGKTRGPDGKPVGMQVLGAVDDERLSRALWLHYLAGTSVASEPARQSIVQGILELVERPVGTVAAQVV